MKIKVAITSTDLTSLDHRQAFFSAPGGLLVSVGDAKAIAVSGIEQVRISPRGQSADVLITSKQGKIIQTLKGSEISLKADKAPHSIFVDSLKRARANGQQRAEYKGDLLVSVQAGKIRIRLQLDLEDYLRGVLESEIPASYHEEALKAQAVAARTYALNPRLSHEKDKSNVCDSYLCCQYFAGHKQVTSSRHLEAIESTSGEIVVYAGKPILALFSSNAGGHTSNYENCFSDPSTGQFPPPPIPYLRGVAEGNLSKAFSENSTAAELESALKALWHSQTPNTYDSWSPHFKWHVRMPAQALEAHMHHELSKLMKEKETAPFVIPPKNGQFGHIEKFSVSARGASGVAIELNIHTSAGIWKVKKELIIRSAFKNPELKLARLKSARLFFEHENDHLGLLNIVTVRGLGWGHGVGLQQTGAQGMALKGKSYRDIISHYFTNTQIERISS